MLTDDDLIVMARDLLEIRDDLPASIALRRGATTLSAQTVRLGRSGTTGRGTRVDSPAGQEYRAPTIVLGAPALDIAVEDRFNAAGVLYRVIEVTRYAGLATFATTEKVE